MINPKEEDEDYPLIDRVGWCFSESEWWYKRMGNKDHPKMNGQDLSMVNGCKSRPKNWAKKIGIIDQTWGLHIYSYCIYYFIL